MTKMPSASQPFELCPAGSHIAVCYQVIELGTQQDNFEGKITNRFKIWLGWEIADEVMEDGRPFMIGKEYTLSSDSRSILRQHLESWRGKPFEDAELGPEGSFEIQHIIGVGCMLGVEHYTKQSGDQGARVKTLMRMPKGSDAPRLNNEAQYLSLDRGEFERELFDSLGEWMRTRIAGSPEYGLIMAAESRNGAPQESEVEKITKPARPTPGVAITEDEVPF